MLKHYDMKTFGCKHPIILGIGIGERPGTGCCVHREKAHGTNDTGSMRATETVWTW
jgi:hypothetical protein